MTQAQAQKRLLLAVRDISVVFGIIALNGVSFVWRT
jgi:hypothetical protein